MRVALDARSQRFLSAAGLLLVCGAAIRWLHWPLVMQCKERAPQARELHVKSADAKTLLPRLVEEEASAQQTRLQLDAALAYIGNDESVARILETLQHHAETLHVEFSAMKSSETEEPGQALALGEHMTLRQVPITMTVVGPYRQVGAFLGTLDGAPFLAQVQRLSVKRQSDTSPSVEAEMTLALYYANRAHQATSGAAVSAHDS